MSQISVETCEIEGLKIITPTVFGDERGYFMETYNYNDFKEAGIYYKLTKDGRLQAHFYNHSNYNTNYSSFSFDRLAPYTQGLGVTYSRSFDRFSDLFKRKKTFAPNNGPMIGKPKEKVNP